MSLSAVSVVLLSCVLLLLSCPRLVNGVVLSGSLNSGDSFKLLGRFAFNVIPSDAAIKSRITMDIESPAAFDNLVVALYYEDWDAFQGYNAEQSCVQKLSYASSLMCTASTNDDCPTTPEGKIRYPTSWVSDTYLSDDGVPMRRGTSPFTFVNSIEVEWIWVALANCNARACSQFGQLCDAPLMNISYKITLENTVDFNDAEAGLTQLAADDRPVLVVMVASAVLEGVVMIFAILVMIWLKNHPGGSMLHHTVKILFASIMASFLGALFFAIHLAVLSEDGTGVVALSYVGITFFALSSTLMLLDIIALTKGWTIVRRKISAGGRMKIAAFLTCFFVIYLTCIFWAALSTDVSSETTIYESGPGLVVVSLRFAAALWFISAAANTTKRFAKKRGFFIKFFIFAGMWIFSMPVVCLLAYALPEWIRQSVIYGISLVFDFFAHLSFVVMFNPKGAVAARFPFHAMVAKSLEQKSSGAKQMDKISQGEVGHEALLKMKALTDNLIVQFAKLEETITELQEAAVQMKELDDDEQEKDLEEDAGETEAKFDDVAAAAASSNQ